jgi:uncharacterized protein involved in response to NO
MKGRRTLSGQELLDLRRRRMAESPPILRGGFRPFFLATGIWAVLAILLWIFSLSGDVALPRGFDPLAWHRHEMVFGFAGAAVSGFLLTAIPNWTGRLPIAGWPLACLVCLWIAARAANLLVPAEALPVAALCDVSLFVILAAFALREVVASGNRNLPVSLLVLLFGAADALDHLAVAGVVGDAMLGIRCGLSILMIMISVIGGRIIPSFTRNWMAKQRPTGRLPSQPDRYDLTTIGVTAAAALLWILVPESKIAGAALVVAALLQAARLARWRGIAAIRDPLLFVLHIGYGWLVAGLLLLGLAILSPGVPRTAAIHAIAVGAVATMILAVTTRASLGHTGRALRAALPTVAAYAMLSLAALARVGTGFDWIDYLPGLHLSATLWVVAFLLFLVVYGPILFQARPGD